MKWLAHTFVLLTLFYFLGANNLTLFSKLGKTAQTELCDLDEDAPDEEGKEGKDCKEDGCTEEIFMEILHASLVPTVSELNGFGFSDPTFFIPKNTLDKSSPPPRA